jgi:hypothetical protein
LFKYGYDYYESDGTLVEILAQFAFQLESNVFEFLLDYSSHLVDCSPVLVLYVGSHGRLRLEGCEDCLTDCTLQRLLRNGANPNISDYRVTPLQIAVVCWDSNAVRYLLEAGADPNALGNNDGILWEQGHNLAGFNHLHGASPLYICRQLDIIFKGDLRSVYRDKEEREITEGLLLKYGGKEVCNTIIPTRFMKPKIDEEQDDVEEQHDSSSATSD